jgi:hypothetical protein
MTDEDEAGHLCYVNVVNGDMVAENGDVVESGDVVEFAYDGEKPDLWKWYPLKRRYDKETPNTFITAYNNWNAIQHPITSDVIQGFSELKLHKYYVNNPKSMRQLRGFHRYVKGKLLERTVDLLHKDGRTASVNLLDLGVGEAGDLNRWRKVNISFVFGVDVNRNNVVNQQTGACIRYLTTNKSPMRAIFAVADVSKPWSEAASSLDQLIVDGVLGKVSKEKIAQYPNLVAHHNTSFQLVSCMFCIHYMFESMATLIQFADNVAATTAIGGYFIGTAWDGAEVFEVLREKRLNETTSFERFQITKKYAASDFSGDPVAVGYAIDVSQSTFNPTTEYLVDFHGLTSLMLKRGFRIVSVESFRAFYTEDVLSPIEKQLSFMNNVFVYQKVGAL